MFLTESGGPEPQKEAIKLSRRSARRGRATGAVGAGVESVASAPAAHIWRPGGARWAARAWFTRVMECADEDLSSGRAGAGADSGGNARDAAAGAGGAGVLHGKGLVHGHVKPSNIMAVGEELKISSDGICAARETAMRVEAECVRRARVWHAGRVGGGRCVVAGRDAG